MLGHWWEPPQERCRGASGKGSKWGSQSSLSLLQKKQALHPSAQHRRGDRVHGLAPSPSFSWEPDSPQITIHFTAPGQDTRSTWWRVRSPAFISRGGNVWHTAPGSLQKGGWISGDWHTPAVSGASGVSSDSRFQAFRFVCLLRPRVEIIHLEIYNYACVVLFFLPGLRDCELWARWHFFTHCWSQLTEALSLGGQWHLSQD